MPGLRQAAIVSPGITTGPSVGRGGAGGKTVGGVSTPPVYRLTSPGAGAGSTGWLDFSGVPAWRMLYVAGALGYLGIFHFTLPGGIATVGRAGGALPHGHGVAVALYFASWMVVITAAKDVVSYAWPRVPAAAALQHAA